MIATAHWYRLLPLALSLVVLGLPGCSDDPSGPLTTTCPRGQVLDARGRCVDDNGGGGRDVSVDTTPADVTEADADTGDDSDTSLPETCDPGLRSCDGATTIAICNATGDGYTFTECPTGELCDGGVCEPAGGGVCVPGEVVACDSTSAQRVCNDEGTDFFVRDCPAEAGNCIDGECTDATCRPNSYSCVGNDLYQCNADGSDTMRLNECEFGCSSGRCNEPCATDGKNYLGCSFWAADLDNYDDGAGSPAAASFAITVSNTSPDTVQVEIKNGAGTVVQEIAVEPNQLETVTLPRQDVDDTALTLNTYEITSDAPITVHQFNPLNNEDVASNDASLLLPATSVGSEYIVNGWPTVAENLKAFVAIIAVAEGETRVTVRSPIATSAGSGVPALSPGVEQTITMTRGQVLSFTTLDTSARGFTGMEISSSQPVSVFSGSECSNIPADTPYCDHLEQQLFPVDTWGLQFIGAKFRARGTEPDFWRVVAAENGTTIFTNPLIPEAHGRTLGRGEYIEFVTDQDFVMTSDRPISLAQFMVGSAYPGPSRGCDTSSPFGSTAGCAIPRNSSCNGDSGIGDPAFLINVPTAQFRESYIVLTPPNYAENYLTIIARSTTTVTLDGVEVTASRQRVGGWDVMRISAAEGVHRVEADDPIGLAAYGYACDVSYAYPGGLNLDSL